MFVMIFKTLIKLTFCFPHRHFTREALPRLDNYRNMMSIQAAYRPTLDELHNATLTGKVSNRFDSCFDCKAALPRDVCIVQHMQMLHATQCCCELRQRRERQFSWSVKRYHRLKPSAVNHGHELGSLA